MFHGDWCDALEHRLSAIEPYWADEGSLLRAPGPRSIRGARSDGMEGFARAALGWSFLAAGRGSAGRATALPGPAGRLDPVVGRNAERIRSGLAAGVRSTWDRPRSNPQTLVESALLVLAIDGTRAILWNVLAEQERGAVLAWFRSCLQVQYRPSNWFWFEVIVRSFLAREEGHEDPVVAELLNRIERLHAGGGWYRDGTGRQFDWYNAWAFHFYPFLWARMVPEAAAQWLPRWQARLSDYLADIRHLVGSSGAPLFQGRSGTYRSAVIAPFWLGQLERCSPLEPGETAALTRRILQFFDDERDPLRVGWARGFEPMRQIYTGAASPLWALKGFVGLLIDPGDQVWSAAERPLAVEQSDFTRIVEAPGWLVTGTRGDGIVRIANHGTDGSDTDRPRADMSSYGRLAYSTATAPLYNDFPSRPSGIPDNSVVVRDRSGAMSSRTPFQLSGLGPTTAASVSALHWPLPMRSRERTHDLLARLRATRDKIRAGGAVSNYRPVGTSRSGETPVAFVSFPHGPWELRVACLLTPAVPGPRVTVQLTGWAVPGREVFEVPVPDGVPGICGGGDGGGVSALFSFAVPVRGMTSARVVMTRGRSPAADRCTLPVLAGTWDGDGVVAGIFGMSADPTVPPGGPVPQPELTVRRRGPGLSLDVGWPSSPVITWALNEPPCGTPQ